MLNSKKGVQFTLVQFIFAIITLILLIFFFMSTISDAEFNSNKKTCSSLISQVPKSNSFFNLELDDYNERFYSFVENNCPSFEEELNDKSTRLVVDKVISCSEMMNSGNLFLPPNMYGEGMCFYCGEIKFEENYDLDNFQSKLNSEFDSDFEVKNLNSESLGVFFYQYRDDVSGLSTVSNFLDRKINSFGGFARNFVDISNPDVKSYSGITFAEIREVEENDLEVERFYLDGVEFSNKLNCRTIVPINN